MLVTIVLPVLFSNMTHLAPSVRPPLLVPQLPLTALLALMVNSASKVQLLH